VRVGQIDFPAI